MRRQGDLTQQDKDLALMSAACYGNIDGVRLLIDSGASVKAVDGNYDDAMILAAESQHTEIVRVLLDNGALPNEANVHHYTPLVHACKEENIDLVKLLLAHIDFQGCDKSIVPRCDFENPDIPAVHHYSNKLRPFPWLTPLMYAVKACNVELVKILLEANVPLNESDRREQTAVHHALLDYKPEILDLLLEANSAVNTEDNYGRTPLYIACIFERNEEMMLKLLRHGAEPKYTGTNLTKFYRYHPAAVLYETAAFGSREIIQTLCEAGAEVDFTTISGHTPLINAIDNFNIGAVKVLLQYGCRLDFVSQLHTRNWEMGRKYIGPANLEIIKRLHAVGAFTGKDLHILIERLTDEKHLYPDSEKVYSKLLEELTSYPLKLSLICRKTVRDVIQKPLPSSVRQLGLPPIISEFLLYSDMSWN